MAGERKPTRKRARPDENTDTSAPASPRKRQATGSSRSSAATSTNTSSENTPESRIVQSPYFSPPKKAHDNARKKRLLAASHSLLNENSRFIKRPSVTASPAELAEIKGRDRPNVVGTTAAITRHLVSELSKTKSRKLKTRRNPEPDAPEESSELSVNKANLTALEKQVSSIKNQYPGVVLMFEVGYKCLLFEEDAEIAHKELGVQFSKEGNVPTAMVTMERRNLYLKKLLYRGYKVGLVDQMETRALKKVGETRNETFKREVTQVYTVATYVDELGSIDQDHPPTLMCVVEECGRPSSDTTRIGITVVCPTTGEVTYDEFQDNKTRGELENRIVHARPHELLLPESGLSRETERLLTHYANHPDGDIAVRMERFDKSQSYTDAFSYLSKFYTENGSAALVGLLTEYPKQVIIALAHMVEHLSRFNISRVFRKQIRFKHFTERNHMLLNANTLTNLEIYRNETDYQAEGSLLGILNKTKTKFGLRKLRELLGRPLLDIKDINKRLEAVQEIHDHSESRAIAALLELLSNLPDLEKGLCRIQYGSCTPSELCDIIEAFHSVANKFPEYHRPADVGCDASILNSTIFVLPKLRPIMTGIMDQFNNGAAKAGKKDKMWTEASKYCDLVNRRRDVIIAVEFDLDQELQTVRKRLGDDKIEFKDLPHEKCFVEISRKKIEDGSTDIPDDWAYVGGTTVVKRYRTPKMAELSEERARAAEKLEVEANKAYASFLTDVIDNYGARLRDVTNRLAIADCLQSFAAVAKEHQTYVRPKFTEDDTLEIVGGRHPIVETLLERPCIANSIRFGGQRPGGEPCKVITGPNMGGKSSTTKMVALIAVMAQVGSFVPAEGVTMGILDGIMTRMGASDELARGRSTFMVEMVETSLILEKSTPRSLVILDELGRGTSTFDGMAIAHATLRQLMQHNKCKTLFVTHYASVAQDLQRRCPRQVENLHMGYKEDILRDGLRDVVFLYKLTPGITTESFGVECGRLAGLPEPLLEVAASKSRSLRLSVEAREKRNRFFMATKLLRDCLCTGDADAIGELKDMVKDLALS